MDIGDAVRLMRRGHRVTRAGWNGRGMWLWLREPACYPVGAEPSTLPYVLMRTAGGGVVPWLCSQSDLLAVDWAVVQ